MIRNKIENITALQDELQKIGNDISALLAVKYIDDELRKMVESNRKINVKNTFYTYCNRGFISDVVMGIRRQVKFDKKSISLVRFLRKMQSNRKLFAENPISYKDIQDDIDELKEKSEYLEKFADKHLAHLDKRALNNEVLVDFGEIREVLDLFVNKLNKYVQIVFLNNGLPKGPYIDDADTWKDIFKTPWIVE